MRPAWALLLVLAIPGPESELGPPVRLEAGGKPIDVAGGHAAPALSDMDGDGAPDLLVGQFLGSGNNLFGAEMRLHRNAGSAKAPRFEPHRLLEGDGAACTVPTG